MINIWTHIAIHYDCICTSFTDLIFTFTIGDFFMVFNLSPDRPTCYSISRYELPTQTIVKLSNFRLSNFSVLFKLESSFELSRRRELLFVDPELFRFSCSRRFNSSSIFRNFSSSSKVLPSSCLATFLDRLLSWLCLLACRSRSRSRSFSWSR